MSNIVLYVLSSASDLLRDAHFGAGNDSIERNLSDMDV